MSRIQLDQDIKPLSEFRSSVTAFLKQVRETKRPLLITQHGKGSAVLMDVSEYEALQARLELLEDIHAAETQLANSEGIEHEDAKAQILNKLKTQ